MADRVSSSFPALRFFPLSTSFPPELFFRSDSSPKTISRFLDTAHAFFSLVTKSSKCLFRPCSQPLAGKPVFLFFFVMPPESPPVRFSFSLFLVPFTSQLPPPSIPISHPPVPTILPSLPNPPILLILFSTPFLPHYTPPLLPFRPFPSQHRFPLAPARPYSHISCLQSLILDLPLQAFCQNLLALYDLLTGASPSKVPTMPPDGPPQTPPRRVAPDLNRLLFLFFFFPRTLARHLLARLLAPSQRFGQMCIRFSPFVDTVKKFPLLPSAFFLPPSLLKMQRPDRGSILLGEP